MIMSRLLQKPRVKILTLCVCLGTCVVRRRLQLARGTRAGLLRTRQGAISRKRIMSKPASSSATPSSAKPICCRPGRRSPRSTSRSKTSPALAGTLAPDHRTCTKRSRRHDQAGADLFVGRRQCARPGPEARQQSRRNRSEEHRRPGAKGRHSSSNSRTTTAPPARRRKRWRSTLSTPAPTSLSQASSFRKAMPTAR